LLHVWYLHIDWISSDWHCDPESWLRWQCFCFCSGGTHFES
jgi:hypothetical protein